MSYFWETGVYVLTGATALIAFYYAPDLWRAYQRWHSSRAAALVDQHRRDIMFEDERRYRESVERVRKASGGES